MSNLEVKNFLKKKDIHAKIGILGAPGSGKSTLSAGLYYFSKLFQFKTDLVPEVAKWDKYKNVDFTKNNYEKDKFKRQKDLESIYPQELDILICEAPLIISSIYSEYYRGKDDPIAQEMYRLAEKEKNNYTHFILTRKLHEGFEDFGRNESEEEAEKLHEKTLEILERLRLNYITINQYDQSVPIQILEMVNAIQRRKKK